MSPEPRLFRLQEGLSRAKMVGILEEIQEELVSGKDIGPVLLKIRLLSARLGSKQLEEWVRFETEGYPNDYPLPNYRVLGMSFLGHFRGPFGASISNAPIPPLIIKEYCGERWQFYHATGSAATVDSYLAIKNGLTFDLSDLIFVLQGKLYEHYSLIKIVGFVSRPSFVELSQAIRSRLLELTIQLENEIPDAKGVQMAKVPKSPEIATQVFHQTVYGTINSGNSGNVVSHNTTQVIQGDQQSLVQALRRSGINEAVAEELANIISSEKPDEEGLSSKMRSWLSDRITKGADVGIAGGITALLPILAEAAKQFWP